MKNKFANENGTPEAFENAGRQVQSDKKNNLEQTMSKNSNKSSRKLDDQTESDKVQSGNDDSIRALIDDVDSWPEARKEDYRSECDQERTFAFLSREYSFFKSEPDSKTRETGENAILKEVALQCKDHRDCEKFLEMLIADGHLEEGSQYGVLSRLSNYPKKKPQSIARGETISLEELAKQHQKEKNASHYHAATVPQEIFENPLGRLCKEIGRVKEICPTFALSIGLAVHSGLLGKGIKVSRNGRETYGNLMVLGSGESGVGKSECLGPIVDPILEIESQALQDWKLNEEASRQAKLEIAESRLVQAKKSGEADALAEQIREIELLTTESNCPRFLIEDITTEKLADILSNGNEAALLFSREGGKVIDIVLGRYSPQNSTDDSLILKCFQGESCRIDRKGQSKAIILDKPLMAICLVATPKKLERLTQNSELQEDGFLARCLITHLDKPLSRVEIKQTEPISLESISDWKKHAASLFHNLHRSTDTKEIELEDDANILLSELRNKIYDKLCRRPNFLKHSTMVACFRRYEEQTLKITLNFHLLKFGVEVGSSKKISSDTIIEAEGLMQFYFGRLQHELGFSPAKEKEKMDRDLQILLVNAAQVISKGQSAVGTVHFSNRNFGSKIILETPERRLEILNYAVSLGYFTVERGTDNVINSHRYRPTQKLFTEYPSAQAN